MLQIIAVGKNPRNITAETEKRWLIRGVYPNGSKLQFSLNAFDYADAKKKANAKKGGAKITDIVLQDKSFKKNPKRKKRMAVKRKKRIVCVKKNPPVRKRHETLIVGYDHGRGKHVKRYYFTGDGFSRNRDDAKIFSGDAARMEARRIINRLPPAIYAIRVEVA